MNQQIKIISVNINGVNSKIESLSNLLNETDADICLLQETKSFHLNNFKNTKYTNIHLSGTDIEANSTDPLHMKGGLGILIKNKFSYEQITPHTKPNDLELDTFSRVLTIKLLDFNVYLTNIYLPSPDSNLDQEANSEKLVKVLADHSSINEDLNNEIVSGDFNSSPIDSNWRSSLINEHFENFTATDLNHTNQNSYTYTSYCHKTTRHLDRMISTIPSNYASFEILYKQCVGSDHLPIQGNFTFQKTVTEQQVKVPTKPGINWKRANPKNIQAYQEQVTAKIKKNFKNLKSQAEFNEDVFDKLMNVLESAAAETIPKYKSKENVKPKIPNWKEEIQPVKAILDFWSVQLSMTDKNDHYNYRHACKMKSLAHSRFRFALRKQRALAKEKIISNTTTQNCFSIINKDTYKQTSAPLDLEGNKPGQDQLNFWDQHYRETFKSEDSPKAIPPDLENVEELSFSLHELQNVINDIDTSKSYKHHYH